MKISQVYATINITTQKSTVIMVYKVKSADTDEGRRFMSAVDSVLSGESAQRVAFDCEGVNLCRIGTLELVSICFPNMDVYLIDMHETPCSRVVKSLKDLFENENVTKIIHDCRMDCDALYHLHDITVVNVHDTSCFHHIITYMENKNLNDVLRYNDISVNAERDKSVYRTNPKFWADRPLTERMIDWATSDVDKLFTLADKQLGRISSSSAPRALAKSTEYSRFTRDMKVKTGLKVTGNTGRFIGRGGANIRSLENRTGTLMYSDRGLYTTTWFVFYKSDTSLEAVKRKMATA